jgi:hypothetical protein
MATALQIAANLRNAQRSSGPTSPSGLATSSRNSTRHGLAGSTTASLIASESDRAFLEDRKAKWRPEFDLQGPEEEHLFEVLVVESIRVERCVDAYFALCRDHGRRARTQWDADRRRDADEVAARLAKDPGRASRRLEETLQGSELKRELWRGLAASLERHATWTESQRSLALDLLGIHPDLRDAETPVDPAVGDALEARRAVIASEVDRLTRLADDVLAERDDAQRAMAEATLGAELTKPVQLMHRYEMAAQRREHRARQKLDAARRQRQSAATPAPSPPRPVAQAPRPTAAPPARPPMLPAPVPAPPAPEREAPRPAASMNRRQRRAQAALARLAPR